MIEKVNPKHPDKKSLRVNRIFVQYRRTQQPKVPRQSIPALSGQSPMSAYQGKLRRAL